MTRLLLTAVAGLVVAVSPAAASPTVRLAILHTVRGCHMWSTTQKATATITVARGTRIAIHTSCPMDFDFVQTAGPKLAIGDARTYAWTTRTIVFAKRGLY